MITGIVVALPEEIGSLTANKIRRGNFFFIHDRLVVACSGAGSHNARQAAEQLIAQGATRLISWGCAAALCQTLKPGDLILAEQLIAADDNTINIASDWRTCTEQILTRHCAIHSRPLLESETIVAAASEKQALYTKYNAIALDMESVAIAQVAQQHQLPFLAIRAIADPANMNLPQAISHALNAEGDVILSKLLLFIAHHPTEIPGLIKLGLHFKAAVDTLKTVARQLDPIIAFNATHLPPDNA